MIERTDLKVNAQTNLGATALLLSSQEGHSEIVNLLLKHPDMDCNCRNVDQISPLMIATILNQEAVIKEMVRYNSHPEKLEINSQNK